MTTDLAGQGHRGATLLDVNVLLALAWPNHEHHDRARRWFEEHHAGGWATTAVTELGFVRVSSSRVAVSAATTPKIAAELLSAMTSLAGHEFWSDDVSLVVAGEIDMTLVPSYRDVTDAHLLALARRQRGRLVTFDARIVRLLPAEERKLVDLLRA